MRVVVIGATGHIGTYLVPRLVRAGHEVVAVSRGERAPYREEVEWRSVRRVTADREAEEAAGTFGDRIAGLRPDAVADLICFTAASARQLVDALRPARPLLLHCGTVWVHGRVARVPVTETSRGPVTASTAPARWPPRRCCTARRWPVAYPAWSCIRATSAVPAGR
jgi:nucleoside-diphosphate-sugar epimerase